MSTGWDSIVAGALQDEEGASAIVADGRRRKAERHLTPKQRRRLLADRARERLTLDVPAWVKEHLARVAEREGLSKGSMGTFLLIEGLRAYRGGASPDKDPIRHPRFEYTLAEVEPEDVGLA